MPVLTLRGIEVSRYTVQFGDVPSEPSYDIYVFAFEFIKTH